MNQAQTEAVANADAHLNNTGLPTFGDLVNALREMRAIYPYVDCATTRQADAVLLKANGASPIRVTPAQLAALRATAAWGSPWHCSAGRRNPWSQGMARLIADLCRMGLMDTCGNHALTDAGRAAIAAAEVPA